MTITQNSPDLEAIRPLARDMAARLHLVRPLVVFDLESTGLDTNSDRIITVGALKLLPDGSTELYEATVHPGMPIPPEATAVHHITDEQVDGLPPFACIAPGLAAFLHDCDLSGFGIVHFDIPLLQAEFTRAGITFSMDDRHVIDAYQIFRQRERRNLEEAVRFYCGESIVDAHDATADTISSFAVLHGQLERYSDLPTDLGALNEIAGPRRADPSWFDQKGKLAWDGDVLCINFGKHARRPLAEVVERDRSYLDWMLGADFTDDVKNAIRAALTGHVPSRPAQTDQ